MKSVSGQIRMMAYNPCLGRCHALSEYWMKDGNKLRHSTSPARRQATDAVYVPVHVRVRFLDPAFRFIDRINDKVR